MIPSAKSLTPCNTCNDACRPATPPIAPAPLSPVFLPSRSPRMTHTPTDRPTDMGGLGFRPLARSDASRVSAKRHSRAAAAAALLKAERDEERRRGRRRKRARKREEREKKRKKTPRGKVDASREPANDNRDGGLDGAQLCYAGSGSASGKRRSKAKPDKQVPPRLPPHRPTTLCMLQAKHGRKGRESQGSAGQRRPCSLPSLGSLTRPGPAPPPPPPESTGRTDERTDERTDGWTDGRVTPPSRLYFSPADVEPFAHGISHSPIPICLHLCL